MAYATLMCRRFFSAFSVFLLLAGMAVADRPRLKPASSPRKFTPTPRQIPLQGWGQLGRMMGLSEESSIRLGGIIIPQFNWTVSGGVRPHSTFGTFAMALNVGVDTQKALGIPGGTFGVELLEYTGGATDPGLDPCCYTTA